MCTGIKVKTVTVTGVIILGINSNISSAHFSPLSMEGDDEIGNNVEAENGTGIAANVAGWVFSSHYVRPPSYDIVTILELTWFFCPPAVTPRFEFRH
ncbi:unnamed protein product [Hydatigera taeniaeformis]|uniref:Secreted protein n=1 Tax=Hydatigena taeniaeformis TaxID=6205 RepID=A0A0R3WUB6_HYDTA|nr:unnamed protein product [Hydatigera taeniaeformis]